MTATPPGPSVQNQPPLPFDGYRILVADDNIINHQIAVYMLEQLGCRVEVATSGNEAVAMHANEAYDLILMDCQMSGMDGYQAAARIRATQTGRRRIPIIAWTSAQDQHEKCIAAGMDDLIPKPLRPSMMQEVLARWLRMTASHLFPTRDEEGDELVAMRALFGVHFPALAALYQADTPKRIAALYSAAASGNTAEMAEISHVMIGSCASIGATRLAALCRALEIRSKDGMPADSACLLDAIQTEYARVATKMQTV